MERHIEGAIIDIDDTLRRWEKPHALAYPAMSRALSIASGLPEDQIIREIRQVNTVHGTIEYTALIQEMASFKDLPVKEQLKLIKVAQSSRREAMKGMNGPFPHIKVMLARLQINNLVRLALSDAPKHLAYLRLKEARLTRHLDKLIARKSPSDSSFHPDFHMENKPFLLPVLESHVAKPNTDLETVLGIPFNEIAERYFMIGNSGYSDVGLAQRTGMLCYHTHWDDGTDEDRKILLAYAPESALKHNVGTAARTDLQIDPRFEKIDVSSPLELLADLEKRGIIRPPVSKRQRRR